MSVSRQACVSLGFLPALMVAAATSVRASEKSDPKPVAPQPPVAAAAQLQVVVDALRDKLAVPQTVTVSLVPDNPLRASVEPLKEGDSFVISLEEPFAARLTPNELKAVLAHELGHVWIYTHHPYLQTEAQANRVAMRLVPRETLETVYEKVWKGGIKGDVIRFFGPPSNAALQAPQ